MTNGIVSSLTSNKHHLEISRKCTKQALLVFFPDICSTGEWVSHMVKRQENWVESFLDQRIVNLYHPLFFTLRFKFLLVLPLRWLLTPPPFTVSSFSVCPRNGRVGEQTGSDCYHCHSFSLSGENCLKAWN